MVGGGCSGGDGAITRHQLIDNSSSTKQTDREETSMQFEMSQPVVATEVLTRWPKISTQDLAWVQDGGEGVHEW